MSGHPQPTDFDRAPFLAIWETTRSCALVCKHCRASARLGRDPEELSTEEGRSLLSQAADMGTPIFILTGGDPLNRPDLEELVGHGKSAGLRMGTIPAATENLTLKRILSLKDAGLDQVAFSLDAPDAALHDRLRGVEGSFAKTLEGIAFAREAGLPLQINTCFSSENFDRLEDMVRFVSGLGIVFWEVFFLIPIGRGAELSSISAEQFDQAFERMHKLNDEVDFVIKLTEAPHYRRYVIEKELAATDIKPSPAPNPTEPESPQVRDRGLTDPQARIQRILARPRGVRNSIGLSPKAVNAGKGFVFIAYNGDICPSGFLPLPAGNIRSASLASVYRDSPLFKELRNPKLLKGKCGPCPYADICGGSRARAYAVTNDYLAPEPFCSVPD
ncbi:MAG: TIGR04053 family radical SAM/SPASM domain-containing protein [Elusimicrobiota bacterium]|jgi:radical SAM protein